MVQGSRVYMVAEFEAIALPPGQLRVRPKTSRGCLLAAGGAMLRQAPSPDARPDTASSPSSPRLPGAAHPTRGPVLGRTLRKRWPPFHKTEKQAARHPWIRKNRAEGVDFTEVFD